ncbi:MAG TPA: phosphoadenosine phosphosulfate reductase family protein [Shinella sp.]|jgi:3'-phosphoadenosine 5'-phosphosulfate sulfotransferase (PAPS reductase)/FAD synthetase|uniref:phosphoadenosine phosphosulfate reductase domain-containing protein n=1 Tax=Shinella sp. TaxID=1870904 RepID=UPI002E164EBA|nr:phosphoadenosine phosphosulfate reductase family protein [Shinella sp.]
MTTKTFDLVDDAQSAIAAIFGLNVPVYIAFSGGKESAVLAKLCESYAGRFELLWVNTGLTFPHLEAYVRKAGERFGLMELKSNALADWREHGMPVETLSVSNALGDVRPKLQSWLGCCARSRSGPIHSFIHERKEPAIIIHGQRKEDGAPGLGLQSMPVPAHVAMAAPLEDWTTDDVMGFVKANGVELAHHYARAIPDSLDCWACPINLAKPWGPKVVDMMREEYPEKLEILRTSAQAAHRAVADAQRIMQASLTRAMPEPEHVPQREGASGDCFISAFATVLGRSYEWVAEAFGFPCPDGGGLPSLPKGRGIHMFETAAALLDLGVETTIILTTNFPSFERLQLPSPDDLRKLLQGRNAVLLTVGPEGVEHAVAWKDGRVIDGRHEDPFWLDLEDVHLLGAMILGPKAPAHARAPANVNVPPAAPIAQNGHRTASQRREEVLSILDATPDLPDREIARRVGVSPQTVGNLRRRQASKLERGTA